MPRIGEVLRLHVSIPWSVIRVGLVEHPSNVSAIERHHDSTTTNRRGGSDIGREAHGRRGCVAAQLESKRLGRAQIRALEVSSLREHSRRLTDDHFPSQHRQALPDALSLPSILERPSSNRGLSAWMMSDAIPSLIATYVKLKQLLCRLRSDMQKAKSRV